MSERGQMTSGKVRVATEIADVNWPSIANTGPRTAVASNVASNVGQVLALRPSAAPPQQPAAPASLTATAGNAVVTLNWGASAGADTYNVYRSTTAAGPYNSPLVSGLTSTTYNDPSVTNGTTYFYIVRAVNAAGESGNSPEASATPNGCGGVSIIVSPTSLPSGTAGVSYSQMISATGGTASYTFSLLSGSLPPGLSLASGGLLSGTPKNGAGGKTYNFTVRAADAHGCSGSRAYILAISK
jgi:cellulose 1,4-beta-cellobiosidase